MDREIEKITSDFVVIISADAEWREVKRCLNGQSIFQSPFGEWIPEQYHTHPGLSKPVIFLHGGWGKVASASATQHAIDRWQPKLLINLGTCGGIAGKVKVGEIILVERTVIYDIYEQMGDPEEHLRYYMSEIDTSWVIEPYPLTIRRELMVSGDRDLFCEEINILNQKYRAIAGDWESGAIAWVAKKNQIPCLILRGVTDLVSENEGEAYDGKINTFLENTKYVVNQLIGSLPSWLTMFTDNMRTT